jgi:uncharacterized protein YlzI (FlbEa/FlbD family)
MLLKFANAAPEHAGNPIYININHITAVYPMTRPEGGGQSTIVFGGPTGQAWIVEEGVEEVIKKVNKSKGSN